MLRRKVRRCDSLSLNGTMMATLCLEAHVEGRYRPPRVKCGNLASMASKVGGTSSPKLTFIGPCKLGGIIGHSLLRCSVVFVVGGFVGVVALTCCCCCCCWPFTMNSSRLLNNGGLSLNPPQSRLNNDLFPTAGAPLSTCRRFVYWSKAKQKRTKSRMVLPSEWPFIVGDSIRELLTQSYRVIQPYQVSSHSIFMSSVRVEFLTRSGSLKRVIRASNRFH